MIDTESNDGLWQVTLNRPDKANALSLQMLHDLRDAALQAHADPELRAFVLTGAGGRVFCSGADMSDADDMFAFTRDPAWWQLSDAIANLPCLTIAALNGTVAGGGFAPVLACDIRICTPQAKFFYPVLKRGFLPQPADVRRMSALIGTARTKLILMAGQKLTADQALDFGLVDQIVELENFPDHISAMTTDALNAKPQQVTAIKRLFDPNLSSDDLEDCYQAAYFNDATAISRITNR
ncbi:MAG: enoyl-CoA hydratase/isomerase family protein [Rhodobacteraceae bacterium]|nr:enoyl-CoA hydratase/isomerase family protein [Paracoccaceae bacterium]